MHHHESLIPVKTLTRKRILIVEGAMDSLIALRNSAFKLGADEVYEASSVRAARHILEHSLVDGVLIRTCVPPTPEVDAYGVIKLCADKGIFFMASTDDTSNTDVVLAIFAHEMKVMTSS